MPTTLLAVMTLVLGADPVAGDDAAAAAAVPTRTLIDYIHDGGILSYILVCVSIVALALILRNIIELRQSRLAPRDTFNELVRYARAGDTKGAMEFAERPENDSILATVVAGGLERASTSSLGLFEFREGMEEAGRHAIDKLHRMNDGVGIISAVGPMLGLLGTVIGMIGAFSTISALQGAARSSELARFMSMALVCTAEGLVVAIPCTIAFALFRRRIDRIGTDIAQDAEQIARLFLAASGASPAGATSQQRPTPRPTAQVTGR